MGEFGHRAGSADLVFIVDHMTETLVVDATNVDIALKLLSSDTRVHWLVTVVVVSRGLELFSEVIRSGILF